MFGASQGDQPEPKMEIEFERISRDEFLMEWRKEGFECATRGIPIKEVVSQLQIKMSDQKLAASAYFNQLIVGLSSKISSSEEELMQIEEHPEEYLQRAIDNLPEKEHQKSSKIAAEIVEVEDEIKNLHEKIQRLKISYQS